MIKQSFVLILCDEEFLTVALRSPFIRALLDFSANINTHLTLVSLTKSDQVVLVVVVLTTGILYNSTTTESCLNTTVDIHTILFSLHF